MNYYQEITIIKSPEMSPYFIWTKLYTQVHLALVEQAKATYGEKTEVGDIGVSYPEYQCFERNGDIIATLGTKLRIFAKTEKELETLNLNKWCARLQDYVHIKSISVIKNDVKTHLLVRRYRQKYNLDAVIKKFAEHKEISIAEAKAHCLKHKRPLKKMPYIQISSLEKGQRYSLEIEQIEIDIPQEGTFNTYGFSNQLNQTTVPHW